MSLQGKVYFFVNKERVYDLVKRPEDDAEQDGNCHQVAQDVRPVRKRVVAKFNRNVVFE